MIEDRRPFRPCVGITLINSEGLILVGAREDLDDKHWQMPQGGIDEGEAPHEAAFREMEEEIGTRNAKIIAEMPNWIYYRLPLDISKKAWDGQFQGQMQKWFAFHFLGIDAEINIHTICPEFKAWKWTNIEDLPNETIRFKRIAYQQIREAFRKTVEDVKLGIL